MHTVYLIDDDESLRKKLNETFKQSLDKYKKDSNYERKNA